MHASGPLFAAAMALLPAVSAVPGATRVARAPAPAEATDLWVTVGEDGKPKTVTPVATTISGTPTVISAAPEFTETSTSSGQASATATSDDAPQATGTGGAGSFPVCRNKDGPYAPFCEPTQGDTLNPGKTYYVTWDPTFFNASNTTVVVTGSYFNSTTGNIETQAFSSSRLAAAWSFYAWSVDASLMQGKGSVNISLDIASLTPGSAQMVPQSGPVVRIANPEPYRPVQAKLPHGEALYIGLPTVLGFIVLMVVGLCIWNRKTRKIALGNIMSRSRHGYGVGKSRAQRMGAGGSRRQQHHKESIRLTEREVAPEYEYRDSPSGWDQDMPSRQFGAGMPRRDSDALGSLVGTPTEERNMDFPPRHGENAFRNELNRQHKERF